MVYQTAYCTLGVIGVVGSFRFFDMDYFGEVYIYFSNWSNYFCLMIEFVELVNTINTKEKCYVAPIPLLKFSGMLSILITCFAYNFPDPERNPVWSYKVNSIAFHIVLPLMYTIDWFLFYEKRKIPRTYPIYATLFPVTYIIFMFVRAWSLNFNSNENNLYPYFFLDIDKIGVISVMSLCLIFALCYIIFGFVFIGFDRLIRLKEKRKIDIKAC